MHLFTQKVFEGVVQQQGVATPVYSLPMYEELLGEAEIYGVQVILSDVSGTVNFFVDLHWSNDGATWSNFKSIVSATGATAGSYFGTDNTTHGARVRCSMYVTGTNALVNAQVIVTGRAQQSFM